ncbi:GNAT family N-acetyltransferase [Deinococcus aestuarii]|uniref:GNAT family N-acetyltransferase n=1 Tax=Deinococcus aestuarii TaxID=2774531 RepID=UPI001C0B369B|nr:GNAT family N-acetyltransferase [Deinococcus aestuarii]
MPVTFEPLTPEHLRLLHRWLREPHVRAFWDDGERTGEAVRAHSFQPGRDVPGFVFGVDGQRAGFIQRERVTPDHPFGPWRHPEGETWGVDLFIGEPDLTGRGLGPEIIWAFLAHLRAERPETRRVLIDPDPANVRAVRAYARVGFLPLGEVDGTRLMGLGLPDP